MGLLDPDGTDAAPQDALTSMLAGGPSPVGQAWSDFLNARNASTAQIPPTLGPQALKAFTDWRDAHLASTWQAMQNVGTAPTPDQTAALAHGQPDPGLAAAAQLAPSMGPANIRAFHGSPYSFDAFDPAAIGTGEGAQMYGHGLYFAGNEGVARSYRDALSDTNNYTLSDGSGSIPSWAASQIHQYPPGHEYYNSTIDQLSTLFKSRMDEQDAQWSSQPWMAADNKKGLQQIVDNLGRLKSGEVTLQKPGNMYEVNLDADPSQLLDWDKPISLQDQVRKAASPLLYQGLYTRPIGDSLTDIMQGRASYGAVPNELLDHSDLASIAGSLDPRSGKAVYQSLARDAGDPNPYNRNEFNPQGASDLLNKHGIPGIQYLDQGSRAAGSGTHNYVMFNPQLIQILRKYGLAGAATAAGAGAMGDVTGPGEN